jgi:zinc finger HIT domain-containing protein 1
MENSPAPGQTSSRTAVGRQAAEAMEVDGTEDEAEPSPSEAEIQALLNAPPLTYNQARSAPPPADAPPPRRFCEVCGYFGRARCMKCGVMTCSVMCKDTHDEQRCLKFYA